MKLLMTHGYMLSDTGSNVYVQSLCRALAREGHEVHLLCQEPEPLSYDFVDEWRWWTRTASISRRARDAVSGALHRLPAGDR